MKWSYRGGTFFKKFLPEPLFKNFILYGQTECRADWMRCGTPFLLLGGASFVAENLQHHPCAHTESADERVAQIG